MSTLVWGDRKKVSTECQFKKKTITLPVISERVSKVSYQKFHQITIFETINIYHPLRSNHYQLENSSNHKLLATGAGSVGMLAVYDM
jgi:hypothetical protein